jgi:hypothetical protein
MNPATDPPHPIQLISFDIGIKHLAYCILEYSPIVPPDQYEILEWKVVNLLKTEEEKGGDSHDSPIQCQNPLKPSSKKNPPKICSKKAQYQSPPEKAIEYYCNKHATSHPTYLHPQHPTYPLYSTTQLSKMDKPALQIYAQQLLSKNPSPNTPIAPLPITKKDLLPYIKTLQTQIYLQPLVDPIATQPKANHANMVVLCQSLFQQLLQLENRFPQLQQVVIENQIGNIAARMMVLQGMITMFYTSRNRQIQIEHVSSSHKLKYAASLLPSLFPSSSSNPDIESSIASSSTKIKTAYQEHKAHAKEYCSAILESKAISNPRFQFFCDEFQGNKKKKDDLADCFLQGIWSMGTIVSSSQPSQPTKEVVPRHAPKP